MKTQELLDLKQQIQENEQKLQEEKGAYNQLMDNLEEKGFNNTEEIQSEIDKLLNEINETKEKEQDLEENIKTML